MVDELLSVLGFTEATETEAAPPETEAAPPEMDPPAGLALPEEAPQAGIMSSVEDEDDEEESLVSSLTSLTPSWANA